MQLIPAAGGGNKLQKSHGRLRFGRLFRTQTKKRPQQQSRRNFFVCGRIFKILFSNESYTQKAQLIFCFYFQITLENTETGPREILSEDCYRAEERQTPIEDMNLIAILREMTARIQELRQMTVIRRVWVNQLEDGAIRLNIQFD